jgi:hypothetical protein
MDPKQPIQKRFDWAEYGIEEGGLSLEDPSQITAYRPSQPDDERKKNNVFPPAHRIVSDE